MTDAPSILLTTSDDPPLSNPDDAAIERHLARLAARDIQWFALATGPARLLSVASAERGLILELADDRVRRCQKRFTADEAAEALRAFARGDAEWQRALVWHDVTNEHVWATLVLLVSSTVLFGALLPRLIAFLQKLAEWQQ
jgi:hypothetical protein